MGYNDDDVREADGNLDEVLAEEDGEDTEEEGGGAGGDGEDEDEKYE